MTSAAILALAFLVAAGRGVWAESSSANFKNARSVLGANGGRKTSLTKTLVDAGGSVSISSPSSAGFRLRAGLIPIYFYPGKITGLVASPGALPGTVNLQWTSPGNDGYALGTSARAALVRQSDDPGAPPNLSESIWFAAVPASPQPAAPGLQGTLASFQAGSLAAGNSYYFALRGVEADGMSGILSDGTTAYAHIVAPGVLALTFTGLTNSSFTLQWGSGTAASGYNPSGTRYLVELSTRADFPTLSGSSATAALSAVFTGLDANTTYYARGRAFGTAAASPLTALDDESTLANPITDAQLLCRTVLSSATAGWTALPDSPQNAAAEGYVFQASTSTDFTTVVSSAVTDGSASRLVISGLDPTATYYFRLGTLNWGSIPNFASISQRGLLEVTGFRGGTGFKTALLSWDILPPDSDCSILGYKVYRTTNPADPYSYHASTSLAGITDSAVSVGATYYYQLKADLGGGVESPAPNSVMVYVHSASPLPPFGFSLSATSTTASLSWVPVPAYVNRYRFSSSSAPAADELSAYRVWRSTRVSGAPWSQLAVLPATTGQYLDPASAPGSYYRLSASNMTDSSEPSMILSRETDQGYVLLPDGFSYMEFPKAAVSGLAGAQTTETAFLVTVSSRPEDLGGNIYQSIRIDPLKGGLDTVSALGVEGYARLHMRYQTQNGRVVRSSPASAAAASLSASAAALGPQPSDLSVYWHNGAKWVQLYGNLDETEEAIVLQTKYLGGYQLRGVERTQGFNFDAGGISNRFITPNGDGRNDETVFTFENRRDSLVTGAVFDLKGARVAEMVPGPMANSLKWDGKAGGRAVPGGVYVYQIEAEGKRFNGTVVVIK